VSAPVAKTDAEKQALAVLADMDQNQRRGSMSVPTDDGRLLRVLVESMGAKTVVELGTSIGYSATWMALGLRGTGGHLTSYEIDPERAAKARANFKKAGVEDLITIVEGDAHVQLAKFKGTIDLVFLDADKEGYVDYLNKLLPLLRPGGLIVAHNMTPRMTDPRYLKAITTNPDLETVFVNKEASGVGITLKKR
jgi:predicted O-methyltransferase YrrM